MSGRVSRVACPHCGTEVIAAPLGGGLVLLERRELLPVMQCPQCWSVRQRDRELPCWRCGSVLGGAPGRIGEDLDGLFGVALSQDGTARLFLTVQRSRRLTGDALHRPHHCAT